MKPVFLRGLYSVFSLNRVVKVTRFDKRFTDKRFTTGEIPPEIQEAWGASDLVLKVHLTDGSKDHLIGYNALVFCKVIGVAHSDIPTD